MTHEQYIASIADIAALRLSDTDAALVRGIKLTYGAGPSGVRGVTYFNKWHATSGSIVPFVEISAFNQESVCQVAGTVLHELVHVLADLDHLVLVEVAARSAGAVCAPPAPTTPGPTSRQMSASASPP